MFNIESDEVILDQIYSRIDQLISELQAKGHCPRCIALGLMYRGATMFEAIASNSEAAASVCETIANGLREDPIPFNQKEKQHA